jgi:hypothetical protein
MYGFVFFCGECMDLSVWLYFCLRTTQEVNDGRKSEEEMLACQIGIMASAPVLPPKRTDDHRLTTGTSTEASGGHRFSRRCRRKQYRSKPELDWHLNRPPPKRLATEPMHWPMPPVSTSERPESVLRWSLEPCNLPFCPLVL